VPATAGKSHSSPSSNGSGGSGRAVRDVGLSARAVADKLASNTGAADSKVWLIVVLLLGSAAALAGVLRFAGRRSPPAGAA
jgi:hypothetical protein